MRENTSFISYAIEPSIRWMVPFYTKELTDIIISMLLVANYAKDREDLWSNGALLEISFINDAEMACINSSSMGCTGPTNVLSFPSHNSPMLDEDHNNKDILQVPHSEKSIPLLDFPALGSLLVAPATVHRECLLYGQETTTHFLRLLAHGLAHLMGYDHGAEMDKLSSAMHQAGMLCIKKFSLPK